MRKLLVGAFIVIGLLVGGLIGSDIFHIYLWHQFDTIVVNGEGGNGELNVSEGLCRTLTILERLGKLD